MMEQDFVVFRRYSTLEEAEYVKQLFGEHSIPSKIAINTTDLEGTMAGASVHPKYELSLDQSDFERADELLIEVNEISIDELDKDYYLFHFTDEELKNVLIHSFEWSEHDIAISRKILENRNVSIDEKELKLQKTERLEELSQPESGQTGWITFGYIMAFGGGFFGLLIGYFLWKTKKNLPNGTQVYSYDETVRKHGLNIFLVSLIVFPVTFIIKFYANLSQYIH